jgi:hypothetical protein
MKPEKQGVAMTDEEKGYFFYAENQLAHGIKCLKRTERPEQQKMG